MDLGPYRASVLLIIVAVQICGGTDWHQPEQTHIAAGASPDQMIITWSTFNATTDSTVQYGSDGKFEHKTFGSAHKWVDQGPEQKVQFIHKVTLTGLAPATNYSYQVGSNSNGFSAPFSFKTWPAGEKWSPSLLVYGDLGVDNAQSLTRINMDTNAGMYDAVLHVGDIAYDMVVNNSRVGDKFMRLIEPVASKLPYMVCPGNHENSFNFSNYRNRFNMPGDENKQMFYSFNMGPVHFVSVATELWFYVQYGLVPIVEQYKWLEADLAEANKPENRQKQPWIIIFGHRPMYCSNDDNDDCTHHESLVRIGIPFLHYLGWEHLLQQYGVDLGIWAHEHSYERLWPVYDRKVYNGSYDHPYTNPGAPVHIVTGSAGCKEKHDNFDHKVDDWSAFRSDDYGYTRMKVFNSTHLYVEQVSDDKAGAIIDKFTLIKDKHTAYGLDPNPVKPVADPMVKMWKHFKDFVNIKK